MKLDDRIMLKTEFSDLHFSEDAKVRIKQTLSEYPIEKIEMKRRGRTAFRIALIAAALTVLLGFGVFASNLLNLKDGATYTNLTDAAVFVEKAEVLTQPGSSETGLEYEYRRIYADENEVMTQESTLDRMLNAVDYYDYASAAFTEQDYYPESNTTRMYSVTNDVDLISGKGYSTVKENNGDFEQEWYSTGKDFASLNIKDREYRLEGTPRHRISLEEYNRSYKDQPFLYVDENGYEGWNNRADWPNAYHASSCLMPNEIVFCLLTDESTWTLDGESEYLGRRCLNITVNSVEDYYREKWGTSQFTLCVDKLTGILLRLEGYNEEGILRKAMIVSEISIDDPEYTGERIDTGIERCEQLKADYISNSENND